MQVCTEYRQLQKKHWLSSLSHDTQNRPTAHAHTIAVIWNACEGIYTKWPSEVTLNQRLYGSKEDLQETVEFNTGTDLTVASTLCEHKREK